MKVKQFVMLVLLFSVCVSTVFANVNQDQITKNKYVCEGNKILEVVYVNTAAGNAYAIISQAYEMIPMEIMKMASGANYQAIDKNYSYKLYTRGKNADLVEGDNQPILSQCIIAES